MNRREAISSVAILLGGSMIGGEVFAMAGLKSPNGKINELFTNKDIDLLDEIAETIIPETNTPGAKAAKTGAFMALMVKDCYTTEDQQIFLKGLKDIDEKTYASYNTNFIMLKASEKKTLLNELDKIQKEWQYGSVKKNTTHYFRMMKELTLLGFFTSEIGGTKVLTYDEVPGRFDACIPYKQGDPVFLNP